MRWQFTDDRAISTQIVEIIQKGVLSGAYPPGSNMPSVRALAIEAGVNPNTMQKALAELESGGLLRTQRNSGRTVTEDERLIMRLKEQAASNCIETYFCQMHDLGIERDDAAAMIAAKVHPTTAKKTSTSKATATPASSNMEVN